MKLENIIEDLTILREYLELEDTKIGRNEEYMATKEELIKMINKSTTFLENIITCCE